MHSRESLSIIWIHLYKVQAYILKVSDQIMAKGNRKRRQRGFKSGHNPYPITSNNGSSSEPKPLQTTQSTEYMRPSVSEEHLFTETLIETGALAADSTSEQPSVRVKLLRSTKEQPPTRLYDQKATAKHR